MQICITVRFDGAKLEELRLARKFDQSELAFRARQHGVGITQSQISRYENPNGPEPSGRNAIALALALDVTVTELYRGDDDDEEAALARPRRSLSGELFELARIAKAIEHRPEIVEDILAAEGA